MTGEIPPQATAEPQDGDDDDGGGPRLDISIDQKVALAREATARLFELIGAGLPHIDVVVEDDQIVVRLRELAPALQVASDARILESVQFILNKAINKLALKRSRLSLDTDGFRRRRPDHLDQVAAALAAKAVALGKAIAIGPLGQADMRMLAQHLEGMPGVRLSSEGPHDRRRLIIAPPAPPAPEAEPSAEDDGQSDADGDAAIDHRPGKRRRRRRH